MVVEVVIVDLVEEDSVLVIIVEMLIGVAGIVLEGHMVAWEILMVLQQDMVVDMDARLVHGIEVILSHVNF